MSRKERSYQEDFQQATGLLSNKERGLISASLPVDSLATAEEIKEALVARGFVRCPGGLVVMGNQQGLRCSIEGYRSNETPVREYEIPPFYVCKYTVTNVEYEEFDARHTRTSTSRGDRNPVTCITYGRAIGYALWLNTKTKLTFSLPTEPQWVYAVAPYGWQYSYKEGGKPDRRAENVYSSFPESYPTGETASTLEVDSDLVSPNERGICHATGNVSVYALGHYQTQGHWGSVSDGSYSIVLGGNFRLCPYSSRVSTRGILDVTGIIDTVGIRLVHPDPEFVLEQG